MPTDLPGTITRTQYLSGTIFFAKFRGEGEKLDLKLNKTKLTTRSFEAKLETGGTGRLV